MHTQQQEQYVELAGRSYIIAIAGYYGFGEKFKASKDLVYSYVKAVIVTEIHQLQVYLGDDLVQTFDYQLPI